MQACKGLGSHSFPAHRNGPGNAGTEPVRYWWSSTPCYVTQLEDTQLSGATLTEDLARIEICTCAPDSRCDRRKPSPGMLNVILHDFRESPAQALFVGDLPCDAEAAALAGIPFVWAQDFFDAS